MRQLSHTKDIFAQLTDIDGSMGVQTIIENHDAWVQNEVVGGQITAAMRVQLARTPRSETVTRRISIQRNALAAMVTVLPTRIASAG